MTADATLAELVRLKALRGGLFELQLLPPIRRLMVAPASRTIAGQIDG
jgi:hypothetical protein